MPRTYRWVRPADQGWEVAETRDMATIAVHRDAVTALRQARQEIAENGGGELSITSRDGSTAAYRLLRASPAPWFDLVVPWALLLLPGVLTAVLGPLAPTLFAPAILTSDGTVQGVALATFVLSSAAATVTAVLFIWWGQTSWQALLVVASVTLLVANLIASVVGTGSLDFLRYRPAGLPYGPWPLVLAVSVGQFLVAGYFAYGVGGELLGLTAGAFAGWRLAAWVLDRRLRRAMKLV